MKTEYKFAIILIVVLVIVLTCRAYFKNDYSIEKVDNLVLQIVAKQEKQNIHRLLEYSKNTDIDGGGSIHYHASLYIVYKFYPTEFFSLQNSKRYSKTIERVVKFGERYFEDWYPGMNIDAVIKGMRTSGVIQ